MNILTQTQQDAKAAFLDAQRAEMLRHYEQTSPEERKATIRHIDGFLPASRSKDERVFWLRFRQKLERLNEQPRTEVK